MSSSDRTRKSDASSTKSLTPQRKHRKLLKDGSGTEVWPESVEKIFVKGLREYWDSPWATYSQARGRSRWRNQFLVEYLQKEGITRTKKQVASHIQVLRNMWKGESEFHLVAGGDEMSLEADSPSSYVKLEEQTDLIPFDYDEIDSPSSNTTSPNYSPYEFKSEFPPSPGQPLASLSPTESHSPSNSYPSTSHRNTSPSHIGDLGFPPSAPRVGHSIYPSGGAVQQSSHSRQLPFRPGYPPEDDSVNLAPYAPPNLVYQTPSRPSLHPVQTNVFPSATHLVSFSSTHSATNRVTAVHLAADGMAPYSIKVDALITPTPGTRSVPVLKVKLSITSVDDIRSPPILHGFTGSVCLTSVWMISGKCVTKVFIGGTCISEEVESLEVSHVDVGTVFALLPESSLSRCRWFDASVQTIITQEIFVDNELVLYNQYELDRRSGGGLPTADLVSYGRHPGPDKASVSYSTSSYPLSGSTTYPSFPSSQSLNCASQTSLSCALTPVKTIRHAMTGSMSF